MLLVLLVGSLVLPAVGPGEGSLAVHLVVNPASGEDVSVAPGVGALSLDVVVLELALIVRAVAPGEFTVAFL